MLQPINPLKQSSIEINSIYASSFLPLSTDYIMSKQDISGNQSSPSESVSDLEMDLQMQLEDYPIQISKVQTNPTSYLENGETENGFESKRCMPRVASRTLSQLNHSQKPKFDSEEEELSDREEEQISQFEASLFPDRKTRYDAKSVVSSYKSNVHPYGNADSMSETVKNTDATKDHTVKRDSKRELLGRMKGENRLKMTDMETDKDVPVGQREKVEHKKRFSKKQLELVSRKFMDFHAYETKREYDGEKISLRDIAQVFELGHATIHKLYAQWIDDPNFYERSKRYDRYRKQTKNPQRRVTLDRLQHITRLIKENPFLTQHQICVELNKIEELKLVKDGKRVQMTRTVVGKLLRMGKFRKKRVKCVPKQKNTTLSLDKRYDYCVKFKQILERNAKIYFLDESGFNLYMTRDKAWSRPNEQITVNCPISKGKRFSLIAIIGQDGVAHWRFIEGNYRKFEYLDFIRELFVKLAESAHESEEEEEKWIVMDNCAIHDKEQTINLAKEYGINILFLPSYSPQLNPIENWFHEIKCKLKKINYSGEQQLFKIMEKILKEYETRNFTNYYHRSVSFVEKGLRKEKF